MYRYCQNCHDARKVTGDKYTHCLRCGHNVLVTLTDAQVIDALKAAIVSMPRVNSLVSLADRMCTVGERMERLYSGGANSHEMYCALRNETNNWHKGLISLLP